MYSDANKNTFSDFRLKLWLYTNVCLRWWYRVARFEADRSNKRTRKLYSSLDLVHNNGAYIQF